MSSRSCPEPWAPPARIHGREDITITRPAPHGEMYVFGALVVVVTAAGRIGLFIADCPIDSWKNRR